jgi:hypothetical protein
VAFDPLYSIFVIFTLAGFQSFRSAEQDDIKTQTPINIADTINADIKPLPIAEIVFIKFALQI